MQQNQNLKAGVFLILAMMSFVSGDTIVKYMVDDLNLGMIIAIRGLFALIIVSALMSYHKLWGSLHYLKNKMVLLRTLAETFATLCFFLGLTQLTIGNVTSIMQVIPLTVALGAALFLGETVGWRRWIAIIVGLIGVLIIIRPGLEGFNNYSLFTVGAVICVTTRDLITRKFDAKTPTLVVTFATTFMGLILGMLMIAPLGGLEPVNMTEILLAIAGAVTIIFAHQSIIVAMRIGEVSFISPLRYFGLPFAICLGYIVFGDIPDFWMLVGGAIVVSMGLYTFHRERLRAKNEAKSA